MLPSVATALATTELSIDSADVLAPADDLTHKSFERIDRNVVATLQRCLNNFRWRQQAVIEARSHHGMKQNRLVNVHCIFELAKPRKPVIEEIIECCESLLTRDRIAETIAFAWSIRKLTVDIIASLRYLLRRAGPIHAWHTRVLWKLLAILRIKTPLTANRLAPRVEQDIESLTLLNIEVREEPFFSFSAEVLEYLPRC